MTGQHKGVPPQLHRVSVYLTDEEYLELENYRRLYKIKAKMKVAYTTNALIRACIKTCIAHFIKEDSPNLVSEIIYNNGTGRY